MNYLKIIVGIFLFTIVSCESNRPLEMDYCEMLSKDQSFTKSEVTDTAILMENHVKRSQMFVDNFEQIIRLTNESGFPDMSSINQPQDSCKYWAITMTLIHMAQVKPEIFFSDKVISIFKEQLNKGNMVSGMLMGAFNTSFMTNEFCDSLEMPIQKAIQVWGMEPYLKKEPRFRKCE